MTGGLSLTFDWSDFTIDPNSWVLSLQVMGTGSQDGARLGTKVARGAKWCSELVKDLSTVLTEGVEYEGW